jgi:cytochrome c
MIRWILTLEHPPEPEAAAPLPSRDFFSGWGEFFEAVGRRLSPRNSPGDGLRLDAVHPSFALDDIRPPDFQPRVGGLDFLSDGRLAVATWDRNGAVYLVDGLLGGGPPSVRRIAAGLAEPLGLAVVDDVIHVLQKPELTRLVDRDGDDEIDLYETVSQPWTMTTNFHEFAFGLAHRRPYFYATLATAILPGGASAPDQAPHRGRVVRIDERDGALDFPASGLRTPNGVGFGPRDLLYVTDNQGDWLPSSKVLALAPGSEPRFFGSRAVLGERAASLSVTPPAVWLPQGEIGNSPTQPVAIELGPWAGQLLVADVTHGGIKRVFLEEVAGVLQGAVFRFSQGFEAGLNRMVWGPDGALYVGGIGSNGNWGQIGKVRFGLQRLRYTGSPVLEMLAVRLLPGGLELEFTQPLAGDAGGAPGDYEVEQWRYEPTEAYGGPKLDRETLPVRGVRWSESRRRVRLEIDGLQANRVVYVRLAREAFRSEGGRTLWSTEAWYTSNALPSAGS